MMKRKLASIFCVLLSISFISTSAAEITIRDIDTFPANSIRPGTIHEGDLMLYGSSCLVLFYETFSSGYSYTRIGHIENTEGLKNALGSGSVTIKYE